MFADLRKRVKKIGQPPGAAIYTGPKISTPPVVTVATYNASHCSVNVGTQFDVYLAPENTTTENTWINVVGLSDVNLINGLATRFTIHPLTVEDILNVDQRPKVDEYDNYLFVTMKALHWDPTELTFTTQQISIVVGKHFILSFQEKPTNVFDAILARLQATSAQRLRQQNTDYLMYRFIDSIVDNYFAVLEGIGEQIETVESRIISAPTPQNMRTIYRLKRQMLVLRKAIWPMREAINHLLNAEDDIITKFTRVYLRDVYDHAMQAMDTIETFRDMLTSMLDMYLSGLTIRMNEIMKTLTIITTIFIPITALASIYGMNLPNIPLMKASYGIIVVAALMVISVVFMIVYFKKKKWI